MYCEEQNQIFFSLLSFSFSFEKEKGKKVTKESKKKDRGRTDRHAENSLKKHERILGTGDCRECSRKCVLVFCLRKTYEKV
jgi:hypothetical protein